MRITNVGRVRHFSYVGKAGKTMQAGEVSPELPFTLIGSPLLWKDIESGIAQLRLSAEDHAFILKVLAADKAVPAPAPAVVKPLTPLEKKARQQETRAKLAAQNRLIQPSRTPGIPTMASPAPGKGIPVIMPGDTAKHSLADLKQHNKGVAQKTRAAIPGVPMNPPGTPIGQPFLGKPASKEEAKADINNFLGSKV